MSRQSSVPRLRSQAHEAVLAGDVEALQEVIERARSTGILDTVINEVSTSCHGNALIDAEDFLLIVAARLGFVQIVEALLGAGAKPTVRSQFGTEPLASAAREGHVQVVALLLERHSRTILYRHDNCARNALFLAAGQGHSEVVSLLLEYYSEGSRNHIDRQTTNGWTALLNASQNGHAAVVTQLVQAGANPNPNHRASHVSSPLVVAAFHQDPSVVEALLVAGADPNLPGHGGVTALMMAAKSNNIEVVRVLLACGADVNILDDNACSALIYAVLQNYSEIVSLLLEQENIDANLRQDGSNTALIIAADRGYAYFVDALLEAGANPNLPGYGGITALMMATKCGSSEVVEKLLDWQADQNILDHHGCSALIYAVFQSNSEILSLLLDQENIDPDLRRPGSNTALIIAADHGCVSVVDALIARGAALNVRGMGGLTALSASVERGHFDVVKRLLEAGADPCLSGRYKNEGLIQLIRAGNFEITTLINIEVLINELEDIAFVQLLEAAYRCNLIHYAETLACGRIEWNNPKSGVSTLIAAARLGYRVTVKLLLHAGVDPNLPDDRGNTALKVATLNGKEEVTKALLEVGADPDYGRPLMLAIRRRSIECVKALLAANAKLDQQGEDGASYLIYAIGLMCIDRVPILFPVVQELLKAGANPDIRDSNGDTPLIHAIRNMYINGETFLLVIKELLAAHADPDLRGHGGATPLIQAIIHGHFNVVRILVEAGANVHGMANEGETPLCCAIRYNSVPAASLLLEHGADIKQAGYREDSPLQIAYDTHNIDMFKLIFKAECISAMTMDEGELRRTIESAETVLVPEESKAYEITIDMILYNLRHGEALRRRKNYNLMRLIALRKYQKAFVGVITEQDKEKFITLFNKERKEIGSKSRVSSAERATFDVLCRDLVNAALFSQVSACISVDDNLKVKGKFGRFVSLARWQAVVNALNTVSEVDAHSTVESDGVGASQEEKETRLSKERRRILLEHIHCLLKSSVTIESCAERLCGILLFYGFDRQAISVEEGANETKESLGEASSSAQPCLVHSDSKEEEEKFPPIMKNIAILPARPARLVSEFVYGACSKDVMDTLNHACSQRRR